MGLVLQLGAGVISEKAEALLAKSAIVRRQCPIGVVSRYLFQNAKNVKTKRNVRRLFSE
jgi:hypothetical protein